MGGFTQVKFGELMSDLFELMGWGWNEKRMLRMWDEFIEGYELNDLHQAIKRMQGEEFFKYSKFKVHIDLVRAERLEGEAQVERMKDERAIKRMIHGQDNVQCLNAGNCGECERTYCPIVDKSCMRAIDAIMAGDVTAEQANMQLAKQYRGIGFEKGV